MGPNKELLEKWNDLKSDLIFLREEAKRKTDFDLQDDIDIVINKLNYHVKFSSSRYALELKAHFLRKE